MPPTWGRPFSSTSAVRGRSRRSKGAVARSWSTGMDVQDTAAFMAVTPGVGGVGTDNYDRTVARAAMRIERVALAPVAQRIEHRPPEPVAQVRVLPGAH